VGGAGHRLSRQGTGGGALRPGRRRCRRRPSAEVVGELRPG
jgi:hypothetical protein